MISSCGADNTKKIDNLQEYLPNVQSKTMTWDIDGNNTSEKLYQYTYKNDNKIEWTQTNSFNGIFEDEYIGFDYYDSSKKELKQNIVSDSSPAKGDYTALIDKIGKEYQSYDGVRTILSVNETIRVPVGTFDNCICVDIQINGTSMQRYYAPGLGYIYGQGEIGDMYYEEFLSSYQSKNENIIYNDEVEKYEDNLYRWYLTKKTFENTDDNHTLNIEVAGDTLRFTVDGQFIGTANLDETDYFPDYNGYTTYDTNGEFIVRYYPEKQNIRIIDKVSGYTDYSGIYEYKN